MTPAQTGRPGIRAKRPAALAAWVAGALCVAVASGCAGSTGDGAVIEVGGISIDKPTVEHWTRVIERGGAFDGLRGKPQGSPRQRALALLISSHWLIGEAARRGLASPNGAVDRTLSEREQEPEFRTQLEHTGETIADLRFEITAEAAAEALNGALMNRPVSIRPSQVADFFRKHPREFRMPAQSVVDLLELQPTPAVATAVARRLLAKGQRLPYHEVVSDERLVLPTQGQPALVAAIFAARSGVLSRPVRFNNHWVVFLVKRYVPSKPRTFAIARRAVLARLTELRQQEAARRLDREYRDFWRARTSCRAGYSAPGCPQWAGKLGAYEDPYLSHFQPPARSTLYEPKKSFG